MGVDETFSYALSQQLDPKLLSSPNRLAIDRVPSSPALTEKPLT